MRERMASPEKKSRVEGYMKSSGMQTSLHFQGDDNFYGAAVGTKPQNRGYVPNDSLKKEVWKPKTSLKWHEPYRTPLTLQ
jgi:hypothetical protein